MLRIENPPITFVQSVLTKYKDPPPNEPLTFLLKQSRDHLLRKVRDYVRGNNWPTLKDVTMTSDEFRTYHALRRHLVVIGADDDGALFLSSRRVNEPTTPRQAPTSFRATRAAPSSLRRITP